MEDSAEAFRRIEKKYVVDQGQRQAVADALCLSHQVDRYGTSTVTSIYYDTPERLLIARSLERPLYKEKLRLRAYGDEAGRALVAAFGDAGDGLDPQGLQLPVFLEIKQKYDGVVYKRRLALALGAARLFLDGMPLQDAWGRYPLQDAQGAPLPLEPRTHQIAREVRALWERYGALRPSMAIACERTALEPRCDAPAARAALRVTFDAAIRFRALDGGDGCWHRVLPAGSEVMELKNLGALDTAFARVLSQERAYPQSFSKYGRAHLLQLRQVAPREGGLCA